MKFVFRLSFLLFLVSNNLFAQNISIGERHSFQSEVLNEERSYQVYLPPSYYANPNAAFPVAYLLDGDYNFHYDSGLIEFLSNTAFSIPEMILIGVSDNGGAKQLENSDPKKKADTFIRFIQSELKPLINKTYRTADLEILMGHSKFGILATHYWMTQSKDFDVFLAIDPSYWFNEYEIVKRLETRLQNGLKPNSKLYIAQANTQGMGIDELVTVLKKETPDSNNWQLNQYLKDNHGSLHIKAITDALNTVFKGWNLDRETFYSLKNGNDVIDHYKKINDAYNTEFLLPWYSLGNVVYYYYRKNETDNLQLLEKGIKTYFPSSLEGYRIELAKNHMEAEKLDAAEKLFKTCLFANPKSFKAYEGLFKVYNKKGNTEKAKTSLDKALKLAKNAKSRQYYINDLLSNYSKLNP